MAAAAVVFGDPTNSDNRSSEGRSMQVQIDSIARVVGSFVEITCVLVILTGIVWSLCAAILSLRRAGWNAAYECMRLSVGRTLLLGLELLIAAELMHTVAAESITGVIIVAIVVLIRTVLGIGLEVEVQGRWPWTRHRAETESADHHPRRAEPVNPARANGGEELRPQ